MKVYLSSTYVDLERHREAVALALEKAGYEVVRMERYLARDKLVERACPDDVMRCDAYVGVFAWRHGYKPPGKFNPKRLSITEIEYAAARRKRIPILVFLLKDEAKWPEDLKDKDQASIRKLRNSLKRRCAAYFSTQNELALEVLAALRVLESTRFAQQLEAIDIVKKGQEFGPSYLMSIQKKLGALAVAPLLEIQIGPIPWWNTRLHLIAALAQDIGGVQEFIFVDATRRFLTMARPAEIRHCLAYNWPALEQAYAAFRNETPAVSAVEANLWRYPRFLTGVLGADEKSAKQDITVHDLTHSLGIVRDAEALETADKGRVFVQREILGRAAPFAALLRNGRLEGLVERDELARKIADKALAQLTAN